MKIDGGCHCGEIKYEAELNPEKVGICHCTDCQRYGGVPFHAGIVVAATDLHVEGTPKVWTKTADSERTIARHDADPNVRAIVGLWHHPPMTNSWLVTPCPVVRREFVSRLAASPKAIAAFSGHCHGFEHFEVLCQLPVVRAR